MAAPPPPLAPKPTAAAVAAAVGAGAVPERSSSSVMTFATRLHQAARTGDLATVRACADAGEDLDAKEPVHGVRALTPCTCRTHPALTGGRAWRGRGWGAVDGAAHCR
jgi:hypothetical protein